MSMINDQDDIPQVGDTVETINKSFDHRVYYIQFKSGKEIAVHVDTGDDHSVTECGVGTAENP